MTKDTVNPKEQGRLKTTEIAEIEKKRQRKLRKPKVGPLKKILKRQTLAKPIKES